MSWIPGLGFFGRIEALTVDETVVNSFSWSSHLRSLIGESRLALFHGVLDELKAKFDKVGKDAIDHAILTLVTMIEGFREEILEARTSENFLQTYGKLCQLLEKAQLPNQASLVTDTLLFLGQPLKTFPVGLVSAQMLNILTHEQVAALQTEYGTVVDTLCACSQDYEQSFVLSSIPSVIYGSAYLGCHCRLVDSRLTVWLSVYLPQHDLVEIETSLVADELHSSHESFIHAIALLRAVISQGKDIQLQAFPESVRGLSQRFSVFFEQLKRNWFILASLAGLRKESRLRQVISQMQFILQRGREEKSADDFKTFAREVKNFLSGQGKAPDFLQVEIERLQKEPAANEWFSVIIGDIENPTICMHDFKESLPLFSLIARQGVLEEKEIFFQALSSPRLNVIVRWIIEHLSPSDLKPLVCFLKNQKDQELIELMEAWMQSTREEVAVAKGAVSLIPAVTDIHEYGQMKVGTHTGEQLKKFTASTKTRASINWLAKMHCLSGRKSLMGEVFMPMLLANFAHETVDTALGMHLFQILAKYHSVTKGYQMEERLQVKFYESLSNQERRVDLSRALDEALNLKERYTKEAKPYVDLTPDLWLGGFEAYLRCLKPLPEEVE